MPAAAAARFDVPTPVAGAVHAAIERGREAALDWSRRHPGGTVEHFAASTAYHLPKPPTGDAAAAEVADVREIAATQRTDELTARAIDLDLNGGWNVWQGVIGDIRRTDGAQAAELAARLVTDAVHRSGAISNDAKRRYARPRPFQSDPTIPTVVPQPGDGGSYPSGHTTAAFAAALTLAALHPERADGLVDLALQTAWSRIYAGVHHTSDIVTGAWLAARIATDVVRRG